MNISVLKINFYLQVNIRGDARYYVAEKFSNKLDKSYLHLWKSKWGWCSEVRCIHLQNNLTDIRRSLHIWSCSSRRQSRSTIYPFQNWCTFKRFSPISWLLLMWNSNDEMHLSCIQSDGSYKMDCLWSLFTQFIMNLLKLTVFQQLATNLKMLKFDQGCSKGCTVGPSGGGC